MTEHQAVLKLVQQYLRGIYQGDVDRLREVFHPNARIEDRVTGTSGEPFRVAPVCIGIWADMATVAAELRFLGNHFFNVLSLMRCDRKWLITHKLFGSTDKQ